MRTLLLLLSITITWDMSTPAPGVQYKVYVVATNLSGESPKSRIITATNK